jgi:hypothetical protein
VTDEEPEGQIVSYSELSTFRDCPLKHHLAYVMRYSKPPRPDGPLGKGSLWHLVMQEHYKIIRLEQQLHPNGKIPASREESLLFEIKQAIKWIWTASDGEQTETQALIQWMYEGYVEYYGADLQWRIVGIEQKLQTNLPGEGNYILKAAIDLIVFDYETSALWVVDHKSCGNLPSYMDLDVDDQFGLYSWLLRKMGKPVLGTIHGAARTTRNQADHLDYVGKSKPQTMKQRFHRTYLNRTEKELDNLAFDAYNAARAAYPMLHLGERKAFYSAPDPRSCGWKCDFKEAHLTIRKGRTMEAAMSDYGFTINRTRH